MSRAMYLRLLVKVRRYLGVANAFASNPLTSAAAVVGKPSAGNAVSCSTPPRPSARDVQKASRLLPIGVTRPRPVITTRRSERSMGESSNSTGKGKGPVRPGDDSPAGGSVRGPTGLEEVTRPCEAPDPRDGS